MAVKIPLKMSDGTAVKTIEELREHFNLVDVLGYYSNGRLIRWLTDRFYDEEAKKVEALDSKSADFQKDLCNILGVDYSGEFGLGNTEKKKNCGKELKKNTAGDRNHKPIDSIATTQEELDALLERVNLLKKGDDGNKVVSLFGEHFIIPRNIGRITYKGINNPKVEFDETFDEDGLPEAIKAGIGFQNINFSFDDYVTEYKDENDDGFSIWAIFRYEFEYNPELAFELIRISAEKGSAEALMALGECYDEGFGVKKNREEALKWHEKAAERGNKYAKKNLSTLRSIVERDRKLQRAQEEEKERAEQGDACAQVSLGEKYMYGDGVKEDVNEAAKWFMEAAKQGDEDAIIKLKMLYSVHKDDEIGKKVLEGLKAAEDKLKEKAEQGDEDAKKRIQEWSATHLSEDELERLRKYHL